MKYLLIGGQKGGQVCDVCENHFTDGYIRIPRDLSPMLSAQCNQVPIYEKIADEYRRQDIIYKPNGNTRTISALVLVGIDEEEINTLMAVYGIELIGNVGFRGPKGFNEVVDRGDFDG